MLCAPGVSAFRSLWYQAAKLLKLPTVPFSLSRAACHLSLVPMRILIATVTAGGGHLAAAAALDEAWRVLRPKDVVERVDLVEILFAVAPQDSHGSAM